MVYTKTDFDSDMDDFDRDEMLAIIAAATLSYELGVKAAYVKVGVPLDFNLASSEAGKFYSQYRDDMVLRGGSVIKGEFVPWLKDYSVARRARLWEAINNAYAVGGDPTLAVMEILEDEHARARVVAENEVRRIERYAEYASMRALGVSYFYMHPGPNPCKFCAGFVNAIYRYDMLPYYPPAHVCCQCNLIPVDAAAVAGASGDAANIELYVDVESFDYDDFYEEI